METNPHRWIAAQRRSQDRLAAIVRPLTPEQLRGPSYHSWTIAQVLGHLGSQAESFDAVLTAALEGSEPPGREAMVPIWQALDGRSPEAQAADSLQVNERTVRRLEALTDAELARMRVTLFGMALDAAGIVHFRLSEHAIHTWDIAVALDPAARVDQDAVDLLIDTLGRLAGWTGKPQGSAFRLSVRTAAPERRFTLSVADAVALAEGDGDAGDGELRIPAEAFVRLVYGRLDPAHTPEVVLSGPASMDDLRRVFPGF